ncbi:thioredoxin family protein [Crenalkalicoccus roseus]|uniref:thioredoxin family protein n=1 Tax=Crenalkalicoccus roseus TaxID=1485588 RepID=UPI0010819E9F|nr:thioredoxin family protein [Crenalkalicoccus roseus]
MNPFAATLRRRSLALLALAALPARAAPVRTEHGYTQDWFAETFLNLPEDLEEARAAGLRLGVVFEQRGCPYCHEMHTDHLAQPGIEGFIRPRFRLIQLDLHGARPVTDLDGEVLEERALARKWRVTFTPTIVFLPEAPPPAPRPGHEAEVARMHGLLRKPEFLGLFTYVAERGYADGTPFRTWWRRRNGAG